MRIAHIILTHKNPLQLERLLKQLQHPNFDFYIHVDKKVNIQDFEYLGELKGVYFIKKRLVCTWGGYSTLKAMISSLKEVVNNQIDYAFYNLLSAQDYPIKSNEYIYDFFLKSQKKSFIFFETNNASEWWETAVYRFQKYHLTDFNFKGKWVVERLINLLLPARKFPIFDKLYGGSKSSWWMLNNESANYLIYFLTKEVGLNNFLRFCWGTDEFVIPTILVNSKLNENIVNNNFRYIDFPPGKANPKVLELSDMNEFMRSEMLFARKFDIEVSTEILDKIDKELCLKTT